MPSSYERDLIVNEIEALKRQKLTKLRGSNPYRRLAEKINRLERRLKLLDKQGKG